MSGKTLLASILVLLVAAPLDVGAASWMALGMAEDGQSSPSMQLDNMNPHQHGNHASKTPMHDPAADQTAAHEHDSESCDEHCMNCSTHCFSSAILSGVGDFFETPANIAGVDSGLALNRAYLLYRPPIGR